jgi:predicted CoA-binding protein
VDRTYLFIVKFIWIQEGVANSDAKLTARSGNYVIVKQKKRKEELNRKECVYCYIFKS